MTETERIEYLKEMGFEFSNPSTRCRGRVGRSRARRRRGRKTSSMVIACKKIIVKRNHKGSDTFDKTTKRKSKKANT